MGTSQSSKTFDNVIDEIRKSSTNTVELGTKFERIIIDFFKTDKHYKNRFGNNVWSWKKYAHDNHIDRPDEGIDIVAREQDGVLCAIQCKFYADDTPIDLKSISTFTTAAKTYNMKNLILVYTGDHVTEKAEYHLKKHNGAILTAETLRSASVDWSDFPKIRAKQPLELRDYQRYAHDDVVKGLQNSNRGQLIMACGTGKTLTSLRICESLAPVGGIVLYLVPSITLIQQSMRYWSENSKTKQYYIGVCSDKTVSSNEEGSITELECPVSTKVADLKEYLNNRPKDRLTVIFCTYNSIKVVIDSIDKPLDIAFCDEAHRTIGGADQSFFTKVHEDHNIPIKKRLYMTATPKIFTDKIRKAADAQDKKIYAMDDISIYGNILHELKFDKAVHKYAALADYRVRIAFIDPKFMDSELQSSMADKEGILPLSASNKMVALWHSILYPDYDKINLLQRVIVFSNTIRASKEFAEGEKYGFKSIVQQVKEHKPTSMDIETKHVDGTTNSRERKKLLEWLKRSNDNPNSCRLLSNARCLSEGVDVPALDGVVFMEPRQSIVDVIQSVGRVMRKAAGKDYGYVIIPVAIPPNQDINKTLDDGKTWKIVWQVLNALRSHDPQLATQINQLILEKKITKNGQIGEKIRLMSIVDRPDDPGHQQFLSKFYANMSSRLVEKVGDINYYDKYGQEIGSTARILYTRITELAENNKEIGNKIRAFHVSLKELINDTISQNDTIQAIAQHMVLAPVFDALFSDKFTSYNPISRAFEDIVKEMGLRGELLLLDDFYSTAKHEIAQINTDHARQAFIKKIYGNFFESADKKGSEQHGIVYTPIEIVDFIINSVQHVLKKEFNTEFAERQVKVLDPFTGTGTFLARLIESGYLDRNIYEKYKHDLYANELILLAYYVATVNIETVYSSRRQGHRHVPFDGISYTDTLKINPLYREDTRHRGELKPFVGQFKQAHERVHAQRWSHLHVIVGNPPYSAGQSNFNDQNQNMKYPSLDKRIEDSYIKKSLAHNKVSLYDSYIRSLRWATDRIGNSGVIGFVTNAGFIRSDSGSGVRAALHEEFTDIYCFDLRGNQRTQGEISKKEGGKIFGSGSRAPVAITILVKNPNKKQHTIHYKDIGDYLSREDKLKTIHDYTSIQGIKDWQTITPDKHHDWLGQRSDEFERYTAMGSKETKSGYKHNAIFKLYSRGTASSRDVWTYNSSKDALSKNMQRTINYCNKQDLDSPIMDSKEVKWTSDLSKKLKKIKARFNQKYIRQALYRPFFKQYLYFDETFTYEVAQTPKIFPEIKIKNPTICISSKGKIFSVIITNIISNLGILSATQCFPLYTYETGSKQINITDYILNQYQNHYKDKAITKEDIFYYVYGMLHHKGYKKKFANNLQKELPRIPMALNFKKFATAGRSLADLHLNYETCKKYPLKPKQKFGKLIKMAFPKISKNGKKVPDKTKLMINGIEVFDLPEIKYTVNGRTPIEWVIDRYRRTVDKDSDIVNDPTEDMTEEKTISMIQRLTYVAVESDKIIADLSKEEFEPKDWTPAPAGLDKFTNPKNYQSVLKK